MNNSEEQRAKRIAALLAGYIRGTLSPAQHDELDEWVGASDKNMRLFEEFTDDNRIHQALELLQDNTESNAFKELQKTEGIVYLRRPVARTIKRITIAASLVAVAAAAVFYLQQPATLQKEDTQLAVADSEEQIVPGSFKGMLTLADGKSIDLGKLPEGTIATQGISYITKQNNEVKYNLHPGQVQNTQLTNSLATPRGGKYPVTLSDGSRLWLNAASSVSYPAVFTGNERRISISGEVYFEIASAKTPGPNYQKPFIVEVKDRNMTVEVLGTHFNLNAYLDEEVVKTTLLEGSVKVAAGNSNHVLSPGEEARVSKNGSIVVTKDVNIESILARKEGILQTKNNTLGTVMRDIGRWYDVEIIFEDEKAPSLSLSTTLNLANNLLNNIEAIETYLGNVRLTVNDRKVFIKTV
jgi:transmembrane sensor